MKDGFLKIGAATPKVIPANCELNTRSIISSVTEAFMRGVRVLVLPELCVTGVTCGDLFLHSELLNSAQKALEHIIAACASFDMVCVVGAPVRTDGKVRNCAVVFSKGEILGMIPKRFIPTDERRRFNGDSKPVVFT
ncbi:MAG: NAD(+) synthase, partial [Ruminiclostridium sp.]|nr:NAD(+) synthase [Ruminiclostridium sp.]